MTEFLISFFGLAALQVVLGVDNVIFLSVVTSKLDPELKLKARRIGVLISMVMNAILIGLAGYLSAIEVNLFSIAGQDFTTHDIILMAGGLFLLYKAVKEVYVKVEHKDHGPKALKAQSLGSILVTMTMIDMVFSIDSTITAIGMTHDRVIQISATLAAISAMFFFFNPINRIVEKHASIKIIALMFLVLIGFSLFVGGLGTEIPKSYVYFGMAFSLLLEGLNIRHDVNKKKTAQPDGMMVFISSPYSHPDANIKEQRFVDLSKLCGILINQGYFPMSPIVHGHPIVKVTSVMRDDWEYWQHYCKAMMVPCKEMLIFKTDGWDKSTGVKGEIEQARELNIPIKLVSMVGDDVKFENL